MFIFSRVSASCLKNLPSSPSKSDETSVLIKARKHELYILREDLTKVSVPVLIHFEFHNDIGEFIYINY